MKADVIRSFHNMKMKRSMRFRRAGDDARDRQEWTAAEQEYSAHLAQVPDDQPIWVQYGHSLKEQGKHKDAEAAYRRAVKLLPNDADAHLQLGHVLKLMGNQEESQKEYAAAMGLKPSRSALVELDNLDAIQFQPPARGLAAVDAADTVYLEIDDLLDYLREHKTVSGIQRVQVGIITYAIAEAEKGNGRYRMVRTARSGRGFLGFAPQDVGVLLDYIKQPNVSSARLRMLIEFAEQRATFVQPKEGQVYFVLGAFWGFNSNTTRYARLKAAGVKVGVYIYDLIPITHPEYCHLGTVSEFTFALGDGLHVFDFILTISEYVAQSVKDYIARNGLRTRPVEAVLLAHRVHDVPVLLSAEAEETAWDGALTPLRDRPFVLVVCTIEPRKNHAYLYWVWRSLVEEGLDPPDLVFVGRYGWRINDFRAMLADTGYLGGRIHVLSDLSDVDLELLYKACLFTAFPSVAEGWGLPVGESLTHGRPSIASNATSIPEVGGDFVDYVDPWNVTEGVAVFRRMIVDEEYREQRTRNIRENFVPTTWDDVARTLLGRLSALRQMEAAPYAPPLLKAGELLVPGEMITERKPPANYAQRPLRAVFAEGWFLPENFGVWMTDRQGGLRLMTDCAPGTRVVAYLHLVGAPWVDGHSVALRIGEKPTMRPVASFPEATLRTDASVPIEPGVRRVCSTSGTVESDGTVAVWLTVSGPDMTNHPKRGKNDDRIFYVGMSTFAYAPASDVELRTDLFEQFRANR